MVFFGKSAASQRADVGIGPYRVLREFAAAHRADRGVRPYAGLEILHENEGGHLFFDSLRPGANASGPLNFIRLFMVQVFSRNAGVKDCGETRCAYCAKDCRRNRRS